MSNPDGLDGIFGDRVFMDSLYLYHKLRNPLPKSKSNEKNDEETKQICQNYLACLARCFSQISSLPDYDKSRRTYLDYLRWNSDIIESELSEFGGEHSFESFHPIISGLKEEFLKLRQQCFTFSASEQGIANEYIQAYNKIYNNQDFRPILVKQAGSLFVNYVNNLVKRCYINKIDRPQVTFTQLDCESIFLIEKLSDIPDPDLAKCVSDTIQAYTDFRTMDTSARAGQDEQMEQALNFAHLRATETALQSAIRKIKESIQEVRARLAKAIQQAWDVTTKLLKPIMSPLEFFRDVVHCVKHPLTSAKQVWDWARENPWQTCTLLVGGICVGIIHVVGIIGNGHFLINAVLPYVITDISLAYCGLMVRGAQGRIDKQNEQIQEKIQTNKKAGNEIAVKVRDEEYRREVLKLANEEAEENIRVMRERDEQITEERRRQMDGMQLVTLRTLESELDQNVNDLNQHLIETQVELGRRRKEIREINVDMYSVNQARDAAARLVKRNADRIATAAARNK